MIDAPQRKPTAASQFSGDERVTHAPGRATIYALTHLDVEEAACGAVVADVARVAVRVVPVHNLATIVHDELRVEHWIKAPRLIRIDRPTPADESNKQNRPRQQSQCIGHEPDPCRSMLEIPEAKNARIMPRKPEIA